VIQVIASATGGDRRSIDALEDLAHWTGVGLRSLINLLNPEVIVLGGVLAQVWMARKERVLQSISAGGPAALREQVKVVPAGLGDDSSLIGAAELAFEPLLADPLAVAHRNDQSA
jgi:predicted NBD/HSP70 family sugar kinase